LFLMSEVPLQDQIAPFQVLDRYWRSPESGDLWYTSRQSNDEKRANPVCVRNSSDTRFLYCGLRFRV